MGRDDLLHQVRVIWSCDSDQWENSFKLPENKALEGLCKGMVAAHNSYNEPSAVILFVIEDVSYNICDQRFHEFYIRENHPHIKIIRRTLTEIFERGSLNAEKRLFMYVLSF